MNAWLLSFVELLVRPSFLWFGMPVSWGDLLGFATGLVCVWLTVRASIWNFPVGIANGAILGFVFFEQRLFADAALQLVFIALGVRGWQLWHARGQASDAEPVSRIDARQLVLVSLSALVLGAILWRVLGWLKGSAPVLDALITALSLAAQWLLNRRTFESWFFWIAVDVISIPLYFSRGLPLIALLYTIFLVLCFRGCARWSRLLRAAPAGAAP